MALTIREAVVALLAGEIEVLQPELLATLRVVGLGATREGYERAAQRIVVQIQVLKVGEPGPIKEIADGLSRLRTAIHFIVVTTIRCWRVNVAAQPVGRQRKHHNLALRVGLGVLRTAWIVASGGVIHHVLEANDVCDVAKKRHDTADAVRGAATLGTGVEHWRRCWAAAYSIPSINTRFSARPAVIAKPSRPIGTIEELVQCIRKFERRRNGRRR